MRIEPLGDQAVLVYFDGEDETLAYADALRAADLPGVIDIVQSFRSVAAFYDESADYEALAGAMRSIQPRPPIPTLPHEGGGGNAGCRPTTAILPHGAKTHVIPCCYEMGPDLAAVAAVEGLTLPRVIELHTTAEFVVRAIGFCPGFPYMSGLPAELAGLPRRPSPRVRVEAGSVGITVGWTCVYTLPRPGGWNLIGRTPLTLVDPAADYFPLRPGDRVRFAAIGAAEFARLAGRRLGEF